MADSIQFELDRPYVTNGRVVPANTRLTSEDLRDILRDDNNKPLSSDQAAQAAQDLIRREKQYRQYQQGITEKRTYMSNGGSMGVGNGAE